MQIVSFQACVLDNNSLFFDDNERNESQNILLSGSLRVKHLWMAQRKVSLSKKHIYDVEFLIATHFIHTLAIGLGPWRFFFFLLLKNRQNHQKCHSVITLLYYSQAQAILNPACRQCIIFVTFLAWCTQRISYNSVNYLPLLGPKCHQEKCQNCREHPKQNIHGFRTKK